MRSVFLHDPADLEAPIPGGVQLCSREFFAVVQAASDETLPVAAHVSRHPSWRLRRKLGLGSYLLYRPSEHRAALGGQLAAFRPTHVFVNRAELLRLAPLVRELAPSAKVVLMSHGNQSGDDLYEAAGPGGARARGFARLRAAWRLGADLVTESRFRHRHLDAVCVMSEEESVLERWLGSARTVVLPRIVRPAPIPWLPVEGRVGFVGTLDHTPNRVALESVCRALAAAKEPGVELRLVGGPSRSGEAIANRYPFVRYLGRLDNEALEREASTWSLFLNPIFWLSRGASMKLGQALAWNIPVVTTRAGARGYELPGEVVRKVDDRPEAFVSAMIDLLRTPAALAALRENNADHQACWPDARTLAARLRTALA